MATAHFADRLMDAVRAKGTPACVGLDPIYERLPVCVREAFDAETERVEALHAFCRRVIEVVADQVAVVKLNIAFFEPYRGEGVDAYFDLIAFAQAAGLIVIGDAKRGDIGHTSMQYAQAQLADAPTPGTGEGPDSLTVNAYFGIDGIQPFLDVAREQGKGLFVLVHTSNASAGELQHLCTPDGVEMAEHVGGLVRDWGNRKGMIGASGFSAVGAVVAPGDVERARRLRAVMPKTVFLVPGFGAQGRSVEQVAACFHADGTGALVNSSRGIIFAYEEESYAPPQPDAWEVSVGRACADFVTALKAVTRP